ncbi:Mannosyltransferase aptg1 [Asimina triloba]
MKRRTQKSISEASPPEKSREEFVSREKPDSFLFSSPKRILALCLAFRAVNALLVRTYFNPDEHWQSLEVAHRIVFGYGHLTWEWKKGIRSYLHPLIFALLYKILAFCGMDTPWFMHAGCWFNANDACASTSK